jgi:hypothetical protein
LNGLAEVHADSKEYPTAIGYLRQCLSIRHQIGNLNGISIALRSLAVFVNQLGAVTLAVQVESASNKTRHEAGVVFTHIEQVANENFIAQLRTQLGKPAFNKAWTSGQKMSLEQMMALALDESLL